MKITANIFPAKIYSTVNIFQLKFATQKYSTKKSCLFNHNLSLSLRKQNGIQRNTGLLFENMYFYCEYSIKMKILMLDTGYFLKIAKINSQQERPICPNGKNQFQPKKKNNLQKKIPTKNFVPHSSWSTNKFHLVNQISPCRQYPVYNNTTDSHKIKNPIQDRIKRT